MLLLPSTLLFFTWYSFVDAGSAHKGDPCNITDNRLQTGTYQFFTNCDSQTYCAGNGTCLAKGCRRDAFPFGYSQDNHGIPKECPRGQFCPDEEDACQPLLLVNSPCQLNRDDECQGPPNFAELADKTNKGLNVNGSVCLNNICMWANATAGSPCVVENTPYTAYGPGGSEFIDIVSRGNCRIGLYCDSSKLQCMPNKALNEACEADKECDSMNCLSSGVCGIAPDAPNHFGIWVYILVGFGIFGGMFGTLFALFFLHRRQRDAEREKRAQYWREQNAFHQNIRQMRDVARASILSLPRNNQSPRSTYRYSKEGSEESQTPIIQHAAPKASGLRHHLADDGSYDALDDSLLMDSHARSTNRF